MLVARAAIAALRRRHRHLLLYPLCRLLVIIECSALMFELPQAHADGALTTNGTLSGRTN